MVFGTFDSLHKGHLNFFKQARALVKNPYLIVSIARDFNVKRIKGKKPLATERLRLKAVKASGLVDKAVLGGIKTYIPHIIKQHPSVIALGYDQRNYIKNLKSGLRKQGLAVVILRLKAYKPHIYKSSLVKLKI
ncbi:MAG TPA: adenylyltransferase/cytidyltransferase family protein [Candidatus Limnocylindria bacterium]|nr:adenylyltransferase/cytidyltransferase family protein [Candidatus Limnocylindria bacterium]